MKEIPLTQGQVALVPDEWFDELNKHKWHANWDSVAKTFYVIRTERHPVRRTIPMHRVILNAPPGVHVDHCDGNGLNNCPPNIRLDLERRNNQNRGIQKNNTSGFKGVFWRNDMMKWTAKIRVNYRLLHLGIFEDITDAAKAYNEAAIKYHKDFAVLNVIEKEGPKFDKPLRSRADVFP